ncbi:MAG: DUF3413 domain-containing protein [Paludibacteraceae bacterium]|nr:DUF3413 domain-containing protein [Paludibacteraceae bacterium]
MQSNDNVVSRRTLLKAGFYFFLMNSVLFLLLSFRYLSFVSDEARADSPFFLYSLQLSHFVFLAFLPYIFAYVPLTILTKNKRTSRIVAMVTSSLSLIVFLIDSYIFSLYRFHINKSVMDQLLGPDAGQVFEFSWVIYLLALLLLTLLLTLEYWTFKLAYRWAEKLELKLLYLICGFFLTVFFFAQFSHAYAVAHNNRYMVGIVRCFPFCSPLNANKLLSTMGWGEAKHPIHFKMEGHQYQYPKHTLTTQKGTRNVLMLVLDSWNPVAFDSITMPHVYEFSKRSSLYTHHYSGSNGTRTGMFTLFFGLPGVYWPDFESQHITPVLMDELGKQGYEVKLFPSASMRNPPLDQNVFYNYADQCLATEGMMAWQRDYTLSKNFLNFIESRTPDSHPFFSLLFFDSLHSMIEPVGNGYKPKYAPAWSYPKYELLDKHTDPTEFLNLYKNMANYADGLIGTVLSRLEEKGLLDSTIVIVTGDHSQEFNDNGKGFWGHSGNYSKSQLCVPFLYFDNTPHKRYDHWSAHYDVVPTLMEDLFSVTNPVSDYSIGKSLRDTAPRDFLLVDSYIGFGFVDQSGDITNLYYDHTSELQDENLNVRDNSQFDTLTYKRTMALIEGFYKKRP